MQELKLQSLPEALYIHYTRFITLQICLFVCLFFQPYPKKVLLIALKGGRTPEVKTPPLTPTLN